MAWLLLKVVSIEKIIPFIHCDTNPVNETIYNKGLFYLRRKLLLAETVGRPQDPVLLRIGINPVNETANSTFRRGSNSRQSIFII